jgi:hypothetical protein
MSPGSRFRIMTRDYMDCSRSQHYNNKCADLRAKRDEEQRQGRVLSAEQAEKYGIRAGLGLWETF